MLMSRGPCCHQGLNSSEWSVLPPEDTVMPRPALPLRAMSWLMVLLQLASLMMSMAHVVTKARVAAT